jgi:hypothetical protein
MNRGAPFVPSDRLRSSSISPALLLTTEKVAETAEEPVLDPSRLSPDERALCAELANNDTTALARRSLRRR